MNNIRLWLVFAVMMSLVSFWPNDAQSRQAFDATLRFDPVVNTRWHYLTYVGIFGDEIKAGDTDYLEGYIYTIYDENVTSSSDGLVGVDLAYNVYETLDLSDLYAPDNPGDIGNGGEGGSGGGGGGYGVGYGAGMPSNNDANFALPEQLVHHPDETANMMNGSPAEPMQGVGGGGGGGTQDPGDGGDSGLLGEGDFELSPVLETNLSYVMSQSGRVLNVSGLDVIGDIIDPSRSINVRQVFQTTHPIVLPDYQVHLHESWRAPFSWTVPFVGETMEIPLTYTLADIRTTFRFRVAAVDFSGILQFDVDTMDEGLIGADISPENAGKNYRKESNIKGDITIEGRAYVDLDRGIIVALCDTPNYGPAYFMEGVRRGGDPSDEAQRLGPGFGANMSFERRDLYTPLGNVVDPRQDLIWRMQEMQWYTTTVVE